MTHKASWDGIARDEEPYFDAYEVGDVVAVRISQVLAPSGWLVKFGRIVDRMESHGDPVFTVQIAGRNRYDVYAPDLRLERKAKREELKQSC